MANRYVSVYIHDRQVVRYGTDSKEQAIRYLSSILNGKKDHYHLCSLALGPDSYLLAYDAPIKIRIMKKNKSHTKRGIEMRGTLKKNGAIFIDKIEKVTHQKPIEVWKMPGPDALKHVLDFLNW